MNGGGLSAQGDGARRSPDLLCSSGEKVQAPVVRRCVEAQCIQIPY